MLRGMCTYVDKRYADELKKAYTLTDNAKKKRDIMCLIERSNGENVRTLCQKYSIGSKTFTDLCKCFNDDPSYFIRTY